jgi:zinc protease
LKTAEASLGAKKRAALASVALLALLFSSYTDGFALRHADTSPQNSPFVLPIVKRDSLLNGLQLITIEQQNTGTVSTHLRINSGALFDLAGKGGLADLTAGMLLKGGGGLNAKSVANAVEQSGLTMNVTVGWDSTDVFVNGPADSLETIFDLLGKLLITPSFDQKELEALKSDRVAASSKEARDDSVAVRRKALEAVFGPYPFGRPARGNPESIGQISRQDLIYFHSRFYVANNSELIVTGDAAADQVTRLARSKLGAWKKAERVAATFRSTEAPVARRVFILDRREDQPARAAIAQIGLSRRAEDYLAAVVMVDVLGQQVSAVASVHSGTSVQSDLEAHLLAGPLVVGIKSDPADLTGDLEVVLDTMSRMQKSQPTVEQVESAKSRLIAAMAERLKTPEGAAGIILDIETYGLGRDYVIHFAERVNAITSADVLGAAQTYLKPQSVTVVVAGPANRFESSLKKIGSVGIVK